MNMGKILSCVLPLLLAALPLAGCAGNSTPTAAEVSEVSIREAVTEADPRAAVDEIYETLPDARTETLTAPKFEELFPELAGVVYTYYGAVSDPNGGLADVLIVQPLEENDSRDQIRDALRKYQEKRITEFEDYDILDAFTIAKEAEVYDQGDFVVLLMLPDNESARKIIDQYIPL